MEPTVVVAIVLLIAVVLLSIVVGAVALTAAHREAIAAVGVGVTNNPNMVFALEAVKLNKLMDQLDAAEKSFHTINTLLPKYPWDDTVVAEFEALAVASQAYADQLRDMVDRVRRDKQIGEIGKPADVV